MYSEIEFIIEDLIEYWNELKENCDVSIQAINKSYQYMVINDACYNIQNILLFRYNLDEYKIQYRDLSKKENSTGKIFVERDEFEHRNDYETRVNKLQNKFDKELKSLIDEVCEYLKSCYEKILDLVTIPKQYECTIKDYFVDNENLRIQLFLPTFQVVSNRLNHTFSIFATRIHPKPWDYSIKKSNFSNLTKYNYFVKIPQKIAKEVVNNMRKGNYYLHLSMKVIDKASKSQIVDFSEYINGDQALNSEFGIKDLVLVDTISKKEFNQFNKGDYHDASLNRFIE